MQLTGKHADATAQSIVELFSNPEYLAQTIGTIFILRKDIAPCRRWAFHNQILVALASTGDARSMNSWNKIGRMIKKGARAIWILSTCTEKSVNEDAHGNPVHTTIVTGYRSVPVFAAEDTEGEDYKILKELDTEWILNLPLEYTLRKLEQENKAKPIPGRNAFKLSKDFMVQAYQKITSDENEHWDESFVCELGTAVLLNCLEVNYKSDFRNFSRNLQHVFSRRKESDFQTCLTILNHTCRSLDYILSTAESQAAKATI